MTNPFFNLEYEPAMENLGEDYYDIVTPAEFPEHILRFANESLLHEIRIDADSVQEKDWIEAFGSLRVYVRPSLSNTMVINLDNIILL